MMFVHGELVFPAAEGCAVIEDVVFLDVSQIMARNLRSLAMIAFPLPHRPTSAVR
jgi:hypothetical protein